MIESSHLINKRDQINAIFSAYGDLCIRLANKKSSDLNAPDVDILLNLDQSTDEQVIVCVHTLARFDRKPFGDGPIRAQDSFDLTMDLMAKLQQLLGCKVNVVDARGLKTYYPVTHSAMPFST